MAVQQQQAMKNQMMKHQMMKQQAGSAKVVVLSLVAVVLAGAVVGLDRYAAGQKDMLTVETRGLRMVSALGKYRQETGNYPDRLDKLVPKHATEVSVCPDGRPMAYQVSGSEYTLRCEGVVFKQQPYGYDSRIRSWAG